MDKPQEGQCNRHYTPRFLKDGAKFLIKGAGHGVTDVIPYVIVGGKNERNQ